MVTVQYFSNNIVMNLGMVLFFILFCALLLILIIVIVSFFKKSSYKRFEPNISIVIPAHNEEKNISKCIKSIVDSEYDNRKLEIIVVDDGSKDKTKETVSNFEKKYKNVRLIKTEHNGKSAALNLGINNSKFDYILTVDADVRLTKDFITEIIKPFSDSSVGATNGIILPDNPRGLLGAFQEVEYYFNNLIKNSFSKVFGTGVWFLGGTVCFRKDALKKCGMFKKDNLTEDLDVSLEIAKLNYRIVTVKKAIYFAEPDKNLKELFNHRSRWFYGGLQCVFKHNKLIKKGHFPISYFFFNQTFWAFFSVIIIPMIAYQVFYWMPKGLGEISWYLFRWFSIIGPFYVLYKIPDWGVSFISLFGVLTGIMALFLAISSLIYFKAKISLKRILALFFYFPYTIILNLILVFAIIKYSFSKKKYFIR